MPARPRPSSGSSAAGWGSSGATRRCCLPTTSRRPTCQFGPLTAYPRRSTHPRPLPSPARRAAARGHHLHRLDCRGTWCGARQGTGRGRLRGPRGPRVRRRRDVSGDRGAARRHERGDPRVLGDGRVRRRGARRSLSRSCAASSREAAQAGRRRPSWSGCSWLRGVRRALRRPPRSSPRRPRPRPRSIVPRRLADGLAVAAAVAVDPALLDLLPADVAGQELRPDLETAAEIATTGELTQDVEAIAVGLYIQPGTSNADDLAIVNVVRLRPGVFDDGWYRSWRTTYDDGACQVAGGVAPGVARDPDRRARDPHRVVRRWRAHVPRPPGGSGSGGLDPAAARAASVSVVVAGLTE